MNSNGEDTGNFPRLKGPFNKREVDLIESLLEDGFLQLADTGKPINYKDAFHKILFTLRRGYSAIELENYIIDWRRKVERKRKGESKEKAFLEFIKDLKIKGLLKKQYMGLSGGIGIKINELLKNSTP